MTKKFLVTFNDEGVVGRAIFTEEEWQYRMDHLNSLGDPVLSDIWHNDQDHYYEDIDQLIDCYKVEECPEELLDMRPEAGFFDPLRVANYVPEEEEWD